MASIEVRKALELSGKVMRLSQDIAGTLSTAPDVEEQIMTILDSLDTIHSKSMTIQEILSQIGDSNEDLTTE